jgi:aspartate kinase
VTILGVPDRPGIAARIFRPLADADVNVDMIMQNVSTEGATDVSFTVPRDDLSTAMEVVEDAQSEIGAAAVTADANVGKVSLVGAGMRSHPGVAARMFETLRDIGVNIEMISTSSIRITCVIREDRVADAVRALHEEFELA